MSKPVAWQFKYDGAFSRLGRLLQRPGGDSDGLAHDIPMAHTVHSTHSAAQLVDIFEQGGLAVESVAASHVQRIEAARPVNAIAHHCFGTAIAHARSLNSILRRAQRHEDVELPPLFGVPFVVSDGIDLQGYPTTAGIKHRFDLPQSTAPVLQRLIQAGGVLLAKGNPPQMLLDEASRNRIWKPARSPHRLNYFSCSGEASIVAYGGAVWGMTVDIGGTGRVGALQQGLCALRPTPGLLNTEGIFRFYGDRVRLVGVQPTPLARTVDDLALIMRALCSDDVSLVHDFADYVNAPPGNANNKLTMLSDAKLGAGAWPLLAQSSTTQNAAASSPSTPPPSSSSSSVSSLVNKTNCSDRRPAPAWRQYSTINVDALRVGIFMSNGVIEPAASVRRVLYQAAESLSKSGVRSVRMWTPPRPTRALQLFCSLVLSDSGKSLLEHLRTARHGTAATKSILRLQRMSDGTLKRLSTWLARLGQEEAARFLPLFAPLDSNQYSALEEEVEQYRSEFMESLDREQLDIVVSPASAFVSPLQRTSTLFAGTKFAAMSYASLADVVRLPAGVVTLSTVRRFEEISRPWKPLNSVHREMERQDEASFSLPLGVQVMGREFCEPEILAVMARMKHYFETTQFSNKRCSLSRFKRISAKITTTAARREATR
eukprot:gnl/Spiro4/857_TR467_c0_g2_i1.p1 gnl/Spiro4/857_TR467_c0_g2~~gnl/Spiro4/857_TR467_c0_g2_i1.p1  ORF type:complete len:657 (+),score=114.58 gnl/Spiro4/857_TR467_c0_g2_i1:106-2076(+)